jgi:hypothetical protein
MIAIPAGMLVYLAMGPADSKRCSQATALSGGEV